MIVTGQRLLQATEPILDDDSESDGDDNVIVDETWCESERMLS